MGACCAKGGGYEGDYYYRNVVVISKFVVQTSILDIILKK